MRKSKRALRKFGVTMAVAFGLFALLFWWRDRSWWPYVAGVAGFFLIAGLLVPSVLRPIEKGWMKVAELLGAVMTRVVLTIGFALAVTPVGIIMRLRRKNLLGLNFDRDAATYWEPVESEGPASRPDKPY